MEHKNDFLPLEYYDQVQQKIVKEEIYGEKPLRWLYESPIGYFLTRTILTRQFISRLYGFYQDTAWSKGKIKDFVRNFKIPMDEYIPQEYRSFNEFFIRRFKEGMRPFSEGSKFPAFAEGRYLVFPEISLEQTFPVKGKYLQASDLLGDDLRAKDFEGGSLVIARLCPTDYHRFHFPDEGEILEQYTISGKYHSVNPYALRKQNDVFIANERQISILKTKTFGKLAYIEVGALMVGKIVQTHSIDAPFKRGDEKGYFLFGGSTVILLTPPGALQFEPSILEQTGERRETLLRLGQTLATKPG